MTGMIYKIMKGEKGEELELKNSAPFTRCRSDKRKKGKSI